MKAIVIFIVLSFIFLICLSFANNSKPTTVQNKMSSTDLKLISIDPGFVPDPIKEKKAKEFLNKLFKNCKIEIIKTNNIEFVDQGSNFESISCNYCGRNIDMGIWQNAMDKAYKTEFKDLSFVTPCCHKSTSLNDLKYSWPAGFAKFVIGINDPPTDIKDDAVIELGTILGTRIRKVWAHY
jgi:hypothetical protein